MCAGLEKKVEKTFNLDIDSIFKDKLYFKHRQEEQEAQIQKGENKMLAYYRVERDREKRYIISLYYKNILGALKEMHRSTCRTPKDVNEVIVYYRQRGYRVQSAMMA